MSTTEVQAVLTDLLGKVAGSRAAILLGRDGVLIAQAGQDPSLNLEALGPGCGLLLRESQAVAERLGQGMVTDVLLEAERVTLAMIPLKNACSLCLLLGPDAALGRGLFAARLAAFALNQAL